MPDVNLPKSSAELGRLRGEVAKENAGHAAGTLLSFSPAFPALALAAQVFPGAAKLVGKFGLAVEVTPRPGKPATLRPTGFAIAYAAPAPVGVTPPEVFGLPPDYVGRAAPRAPKSELLATKASGERLALFAFQSRQRELFFESLSVRQGYKDNFLSGYLREVITRAAAEPLQAAAYERLVQSVLSRATRIGALGFGTAAFSPQYPLRGGFAPLPYMQQQNPPAEGENAQSASRMQATNAADP